jgi:hypothetical protein
MFKLSSARNSSTSLNSTLSKGRNTSTASLDSTFSNSRNASTTTLALREQLAASPKDFANQRLTKRGEGEIPTNTGRDVVRIADMGGGPAHISEALKLEKESTGFMTLPLEPVIRLASD